MAAIITATRTSSLTLFPGAVDQDGDGQFDPGDIIVTRIRITNSGDAPAGNITVEDTLNGVTIDGTSIRITPIAHDDNGPAFAITGNTPITFTAAQLLANDVDPDGAGGNAGLVISSVTVGSNGTIVDNLDGTFTFTPTTGLNVGDTASFQYTVTDAQGLQSVSTGVVTMSIADVVWYVDNTYVGGGNDGSYLKPFTSLTPLNNSGVDPDAAGETIFVFHNGGNYTAGITLEAGQKLIGDGQAYMANNHNIGGTSRTTGNDTVATNAVISLGTGTGVTLATDNTVKGLTLDSAGAAAVGMADGGTSVTSAAVGAKLLVSGVTFTGTGQAIDIDAGGNLDVTIDSLTSTASTGQGVQLAGNAASGTGLLSGTFTVTTGSISGSTGHGFQIGSGAANSGGTLTVTYNGSIGTSSGGSAVNIGDRIAGVSGAGEININGNITQTMTSGNSSAGIALSNIASGNINFDGTKTITASTGTQNAISITGQSGGAITFETGAVDIDFATGTSGDAFSISNQTGGSVNVSSATDIDFAGTASGDGVSIVNAGTAGGSVNFTGGLTITTQSGDGINVNNNTQGTGQLNISNAATNSIATGTGQIIQISNGTTTGMTFASLTSGTTSGAAIDISNLDGGTFTTGGTTIGGTTGSTDAINIRGDSTTNFVFNGTTDINGTGGGDGVELNGANGTVSFNNLTIDGVTGTGRGLSIVNATNTVTVSGGAIGNGTNTGEAVNINGGTAAVTIAASVSKNNAGNVVEVQSHTTNNITFSGVISATGSVDNGILLNGNSSGTIAFTNGSKTLSTGANNAVTITSNGANVDFTGGGLVINTTGGTGVSAGTTGVATGGTLTVSGSGNTISTTTGSAFVLNGTDSDGITFQSISKNGGSATGIFLNDAGTGGFTVTGVSTNDNSGGTIQNITGTNGQSVSGIGLYVNNTDNISLSNMNFGGTIGNYAIKGNNVTNFTLRDSTIGGTMGNDDVVENEAAIWFKDLDGVGLFEGNDISGGRTDNMRIETSSGTLHLFVRDTATSQAVFGHNSNSTVANDSLLVEMAGNSNLFALIDGVSFTGWRGDGVTIQTIDTANSEITIKNNSFVNSHPAIASAGGIGVLIDGTGGGAGWSVDYVIEDNTFTGSKGYALATSFVGAAGKIRGFIEGNTIGTPNGTLQTSGSTTGSSEAGGMFINIEKQFGSAGVLEHYVTIENNVIRDVAKYGIYVRSTNGGQAAGNFAVTEATIRNNNIDEMFGPGVAPIRGLAGGNDPDYGRIGFDIQNNVLNADTSDDSYGAFFLDQIFNTGAQYYLPSYAGTTGNNYGGNASLHVTTYLQGRGNTLTASTTASNANSGTLVYANDAKVMGANLTQPAPTRSDVTLPSGAMQVGPDLEVPVPAAPPAEETVTESGPSESGSESGPSGGDITNPPAPAPDAGAAPAGDDGVLSQAELASLVEAAIQRWIDAGASAAQVAAMRAVDVGIVDMSGIYVGSARPGTISVDSDAGGYGWFVDATPAEDSEFEGSGTRLTADAGGAAEGKVDLLTVLMHELGHQIGLADDYNSNSDDDLMYGYAHISERRLPADGEATGATPGGAVNEAFAVIPATIASLPANKIVDVFFKSTIDLQEDKAISPLMNTATIKVGGVTVTTANENNALDSLTLGNTIYIDANKNNQFDAGEGVSGVALQLYADTNNSGGWDSGDQLITTGSSGALGAYSFAGLAPGDYIVVVTAANFNSGQPLVGRLSAPGNADPDDNVDNDDNGLAGVAGLGAAIASQTITLAYNSEPDGNPGGAGDVDGDADADTNLTLDFGFYNNDPPVANDDSVTVDEDSGEAVVDVLGNDTDPDAGDTLTVTNVTNPVGGTVSLVGGVVKFTPTANFNGTAGFDYTIDDGNSHTDTGHVTVTVNAVNDPIGTVAPGAVNNVPEDSVNFAVTGMSITDVDAALAPGGVYSVTLASTNGTMTLTTITGLTFDNGDGAADATMTFHGTLADINTALASAKYSPNANYVGSAQIQLNATDIYNSVIATGSGASTADGNTIAVTVISVNDAPEGGTGNDAAPVEGSLYTFLTTDFSDGMTDPNDSPANAFAGVKITTLPGAGIGVIKLNGVAISAGDLITKTQLDNGELKFDTLPGTANNGTTFTFQVQDNGGTSNGGIDVDPTPNTFTLTVAPANANPLFQLDDTGPSATLAYTENQTAQVIAPDAQLTDSDSPNFDTGTLTVSFQANGEAADQLGIQNQGTGAGQISVGVGTVSYENVQIGTFTGGANGANLVVTFDPDASPTAVQALIRAVTYHSTSESPGAASRTVNFLVTDGDGGSAQANAAVNITQLNDSPDGTSAPIAADEDVFRILDATDFGFTDPDSGDSLSAVTITAVNGSGQLYFDSDGTAGAGDPVAVASFPQTYTLADLNDGKVSYKAPANANGNALATIDFQVVDSGAAANSTDPVGNTLTVNVAAINDQPDIPNSPAINATEQTAITINAAIAVSDADLDARNSGAGDYSGAAFAINRDVSNAEDLFSFDTAGALFTVNGSNLESGGNVIATLSQSGGILNINFVNNGTVPTTALVNDVLQHLQYTNTSNTPPASVTLIYVIDDGAPGAGQGTVTAFNNIDGGQIVVNIAAVNDAPVNTLGGTIGTGEDAIDAWLSGMSISDPDANPATDDVTVTFSVASGTLDIRTDVLGGVVAGDVTGDDTGTITVTATLNEINATLAAANGLTYSPNANFNGNDTLTVTTNDGGATGSGGAKSDVDMRTITVSAVDDAPVAQPDDVSTPENAIGAGSLFANNGSGPDVDADGDTITIAAVNGSNANLNTPIALANGGTVTVGADGSYSFDPAGQYTRLTNPAGGEVGAVNTSAVAGTIQYTLTNGNTVTVTLTVNGVAGPGDWLEGNSSANTISGTPGGDFFFVVQGGNDDLSGLGGNDVFFFGDAMTSDDKVNGGAGLDQIALQGDYSGGLTFGADVLGVENLAILPGNDTRFGDTANSDYDYDITLVDANVAAGTQMIIDANRLRVGEDFTFDGSDESDGSFFIYGGGGVDDLTGGDNNDVFLFGAQGQWGSSDVLQGGPGTDQLALRGDYTIAFGAGQLVGIEAIGMVSAFDTRFGALGDTYDYDLTMHDDNVDGIQMTVDAAPLRSVETLAFDGSAEDDGSFRVFGGQGADVIIGSQNGDILTGHRGADDLTGGGGADMFRYYSQDDSTPTSMDDILDFVSNVDKIDLSRIDADTHTAGNQAFHVIGDTAFTGAGASSAGELRVYGNAGTWFIEGDTDGDGDADLMIQVTLAMPLPIVQTDLVL